MKDYTITFLILALVTGVSGFALGDFTGIKFLRIMFIIFADLLVVSLLAKGLFANQKRLQKIRVKK